MLAYFNLGGGEIILVLALVGVMFSANQLPDFFEGFWRGWTEFRRAITKLAGRVDDDASEAGRSLGGIYGKPASQALTPENEVAELYKPAVLDRDAQQPKKNKPQTVLLLVRKFLGAIFRWLRLDDR